MSLHGLLQGELFTLKCFITHNLLWIFCRCWSLVTLLQSVRFLLRSINIQRFYLRLLCTFLWFCHAHLPGPLLNSEYFEDRDAHAWYIWSDQQQGVEIDRPLFTVPSHPRFRAQGFRLTWSKEQNKKPGQLSRLSDGPLAGKMRYWGSNSARSKRYFSFKLSKTDSGAHYTGRSFSFFKAPGAWSWHLDFIHWGA
jgi:hypothetical protein